MLIHCKFLWINQTPLDSSSSGIKAGHDRKKTRMLPCVLMFQCNMCTYVHTSGGFAICQLLEFACKLPRLEEEGKLLLVTHIGWEGALAEADSGKRWPAGFKLSTSSSLLLLSFRARPPTENKARKGSLWITFCLGTRCDSGKQTPPRSHACMVLASADAFRRGELFRCWQALRKPNRDSEELYGTRCPLAIKSSGGMHAEIEGVHACMHASSPGCLIDDISQSGSTLEVDAFPKGKRTMRMEWGEHLGFGGLRWEASLGFPSPMWSRLDSRKRTPGGSHCPFFSSLMQRMIWFICSMLFLAPVSSHHSLFIFAFSNKSSTDFLASPLSYWTERFFGCNMVRLMQRRW